MWHDLLKAYLSPKRLAHVGRVSIEAKCLAEKWGMSSEEAVLAGLMHDIAKQQTPQSLRKLGLSESMCRQDVYDLYPSVWHAFVGPDMARILGVDISESVRDAMYYHTTGGPDMLRLSQVLYVADYIEPNRSHEMADIVKELAMNNLEEACYLEVLASILYLNNQNLTIHPYTHHCQSWLEKSLSENRQKALKKYMIPFSLE